MFTEKTNLQVAIAEFESRAQYHKTLFEIGGLAVDEFSVRMREMERRGHLRVIRSQLSLLRLESPSAADEMVKVIRLRGIDLAEENEVGG